MRMGPTAQGSMVSVRPTSGCAQECMLMLTVAGGCELVHFWQLKLGQFITCKISIAEAYAFVSEFGFWNTSNIGTAKRITRGDFEN